MAVSKFPFKGRYEGKNFTVDDVIATLHAQKGLVKEAIEFLEELDPDLDAHKVVIRVVSIEEGSLDWSLLIEIWGTFQKPITEKVTGNLEKAFGVDIPAEYEPLVALATMAVVYWGLKYTYDRVAKRREKDRDPPSPPAVHIEGNYNTVIQLVGNLTDTTTDQVERALNEALFDSRGKIAKAATDFVRPAKSRGTSIEINGAPNMDRETINEVPSDIDIAKTFEPELLPLKDVVLSIRGTDRDSHQAGWRAFIEDDDRFPKRLQLFLSVSIDPEDLANHPRVRANIVVEGERFFDGSFVPRKIHLQDYWPIEN